MARLCGDDEQQSCRSMNEQSGDPVECAAQFEHFFAGNLTDELPGLGIDYSQHGVLRAGIEIELSQADRRSYRLRDGIEKLKQLKAALSPTYVLIDCPPSLNLLTVNAMSAADAVLVPLQCEFFALEGLTQLMRTVELVRSSLNPRLEIQGIVLTMYDRRNALSGQVEADVRGHFGDRVYETVIPRNVRVSEAPSFGKPALIYDLKCAGSQAYLRLARELVRREKKRRREQQVPEKAKQDV